MKTTSTFQIELERLTYNETIHNNRINIEIKNIKNEYKNINETNTKKYLKNITRKTMKNNKPPRIEKAYMNRNFKNKCR